MELSNEKSFSKCVREYRDVVEDIEKDLIKRGLDTMDGVRQWLNWKAKTAATKNSRNGRAV